MTSFCLRSFETHLRFSWLSEECSKQFWFELFLQILLRPALLILKLSKENENVPRSFCNVLIHVDEKMMKQEILMEIPSRFKWKNGDDEISYKLNSEFFRLLSHHFKLIFIFCTLYRLRRRFMHKFSASHIVNIQLDFATGKKNPSRQKEILFPNFFELSIFVHRTFVCTHNIIIIDTRAALLCKFKCHLLSSVEENVLTDWVLCVKFDLHIFLLR